MNDIEFLESYLDKMDMPLAVEQERYGGGYRAIILHRGWTEWIFDKLSGDDNDGTQAQDLLTNNLLPTAYGDSLSQSLRRLSAKLEALYEITDEPGRNGVKRKFKLLAECDVDEGEEQSFYEVEFEDAVRDCTGRSSYWYDEAKENCTSRKDRDLHALINFKWPDDLNKAVTAAMKLK
tara:strand:- start:115 stop:648 length:534 start_codon:yes stop_codon:yes gene_type:complete